MYMVSNSANAITFASCNASACGEIGMKIVPYRVIEERLAVTRAEDDVDDDQRKRLGHGGDFITGFQPLGGMVWP
jgi:hypothetical protein